ncbi:uncharacterized protein [Dermacentor andersoni]|uniref:uncharacterized protein n=1 Tax=Dermacentor andersoni TaxID=34620 RepID=UPI003B3BABF7
MDEKKKGSNERSEEEGHEEISGDDGSTRRKSTAAESNAGGPSASVSETAGSRFGSPPSPVEHRRVEPPHRRPPLVDGVPVGEPADPEVEETYRINSMSQLPNFVRAFRALTRLVFPSSFQDAYKARYAGGTVAGGGSRRPALRDGRLLSADAQVPDYPKNIIDAYGLSGVFTDKDQPDVVHVDDQFVGLRLDLKRARGTSAIPGTRSGVGPSATTARTPSILSSPRRAGSRTEDSQARPAQSVRFSRMKYKRAPRSKERRAETRVLSRFAVPASTKSFIPTNQGSSDDSSSSSSSSTSELELKKNSRQRGRVVTVTTKNPSLNFGPGFDGDQPGSQYRSPPREQPESVWLMRPPRHNTNLEPSAYRPDDVVIPDHSVTDRPPLLACKSRQRGRLVTVITKNPSLNFGPGFDGDQPGSQYRSPPSEQPESGWLMRPPHHNTNLEPSAYRPDDAAIPDHSVTDRRIELPVKILGRYAVRRFYFCQVDELAEHSEPPSELQREKQTETGETTVPQWKSSSADAAPLTSGDYGARDTGLATETEPATTVATELEPSSSYLGVGVVIPPSIPTEDSTTKLQASPPHIEDRELPTIEFRSHPQPDRSVTAEPIREPPAESPLPAVARTRLWQPWILCSAAGAMILLPLAFVLVPLLTSAAAGGARRHAVSHSARNGTEPDAQVVTVRKQDVYVEDADAPISCNGSASRQLENASALTVAGAYSAPYRGDAEPRPQFRPVFCVFDAEFFHPKRPYTPLQIPTPLCSAVIFYSLSLSRFGAGSDGVGGGFRRPLDAELFENVSASRLDGRLRHRGRRCPLYATFGGRRSDSAEFVRMLRDSAWRKATVEGIVNDTSSSERAKYDGVNLDWNRPGDECDVLRQPQLFHVLVESLGASRVRHVIVATHKLRPRSSVDCSGARLYAAPRFREIRDAYSAAYRKKFAYSVSAGGDTFVTRSVALGAAAHAAPPPTSGLVLRPSKTSFESVCNVKPVIVSPADKECVVAIMQIEKSLDASNLYYVAAYAGPKQLQERMHRAYDDDMGDAPVAVFDAFLDDFAGLCPGDSPRMSPQLAAISESTSRELR